MSVVKWGSEQLVNTITAGSQFESAVTALANGGFVVAWTDASASSVDTSGNAIRMQRYNAAGNKVGSETLVNTTTTGSQSKPDILTLTDGSYVVAWTDASNAGGNATDIRFRRFSESGTALDATDRVATVISGDQTDVSLARSGSGFVYAFSDAGSSGNVVAQRRLFDGNPNGGALVAAGTAQQEQFGDIAERKGSTAFGMAWKDEGTDHIVFALLDNNLTAISPGFPVNVTSVASQFHSQPEVTALTNGGFLVSWTDGSAAFPDTVGVAVRGQIFSNVGVPFGSTFLINGFTDSNEVDPKAIALAGGGFAVAYSSFGPGDIRIQIFDSAGVRQGREMVVNTNSSGGQSIGGIALLTDGRIAVTWADSSATGGDTLGSAVRMQILDPREGLAQGTSGNDSLLGGFTGTELDGLVGNDTLLGGLGVDLFYGGEGDDKLVDNWAGGFGGFAGDYYDGGVGTDTVSYENTAGPIWADMTNRFNNTGQAVGDVYISIENLTGSAFSDILVGDGAANVLEGGGGADALDGAAGLDTMTGGIGGDRFVFTSAALPGIGNVQNFKTLADFNQSNTVVSAQGDALDLVALVGAAKAGGQAIGNLARLIVDQSNAFASLQVDVDGLANGVNWKTIGRLSGRREAETANAIFDFAQAPASLMFFQNVSRQFDFNGDGRSDLLVLPQTSIGSSQLGLAQMNGLGVFGAFGVTFLSNSDRVVGAGDFDGDGKGDVLKQRDDGLIAIERTNGAGSQGVTGVSVVPAGWHVSGVGRFDADAKDDILLRNDDGTVLLWTMNGAAVTSSTVIAAPPTDFHVQQVADFNGDGKADILWRREDGLLHMWEMNGPTVTAATTISVPPLDRHIVGSGDFNHDGKSDILWRADNGAVIVGLMNGPTVLAENVLGAPDFNFMVAGTGDFNGDGFDDILWRNTDGSTQAWFTNGVSIIGGGTISVFGANIDNKTQGHTYDFV